MARKDVGPAIGSGDSGGTDDPPDPKGKGDNPASSHGEISARTLSEQGRAIPTLYGTAKVTAWLIEQAGGTYQSPPMWATGTPYNAGDYVQIINPFINTSTPAGSLTTGIDASVHRCKTSGTSVPAWSVSTTYTAGQKVAAYSTQFHAFYVSTCIGGPGSGGTVAADGSISGGTALWLSTGFAGPQGTSTTTGDGISAGSFVEWEYVQKMPMSIYYQQPMLALCEGAAQGAKPLGKFWWNKETRTVANATAPGVSMTVSLGPDAANQTLPVAFDSSGYQHTALLYPTASPGVPTGPQGEMPAMALEMQGVMFGASTNDVSPADIFNDILTHARRGCAWPTGPLGRVDPGLIGFAAGGYRTYCDAAGLRVSMYNDTQRTALDMLGDLLVATNSDAIWSGGKLKVVPRGDQPIASPVYGSTGYVPTNTAQYNLTTDDFLDKFEPVSISRRSDADCFNSIPVEYVDRAASYAKITVEDPEQSDVELRGGLKRGSTIALPFAFPDGTAPVMLSRIFAQRSLNIRNEYRFRLSWRYLLLEPTDIVTLTDPNMGLNLTPVRITSVREVPAGTEGGFEFTAEDYPSGVAAAGAYAPQTTDGFQPNQKLTILGPKSTIDGVTTAVAGYALPHLTLTSPATGNLWPNSTNESAPPESVVVNHDNTQAEWDYRYNAGAGAYSGAWVRRLDGTAGQTKLTHQLRCSPGDAFYMSVWAKTITVLGSSNSWLDISFFDAANNNLGGTGFVGAGAVAWTRFSGYSFPAPASAVRVEFSLNCSVFTIVDFDAITVTRAVAPTDLQIASPSTGRQVLQMDPSTGLPAWMSPIAQESWTAPTLAGAWVNYGGGTVQTAGYMKDALGFICLRGTVKLGAGTIFTLPTGYRPPSTLNFIVDAAGAAGEITVASTGVVALTIGGNAYVSLDMIRFDTR